MPTSSNIATELNVKLLLRNSAIVSSMHKAREPGLGRRISILTGNIQEAEGKLIETEKN